MAERLHAELAAVPALAQVSTSQLRELAWKTKELTFVALLREHASSMPIADKLAAVAKDRKLERKTEKMAEPIDRDAMRKKEDSFRSDYMQIVASELARLGAPAVITWQKLLFDKDCCAQAFRLLLTRIKSSRRISSRGNSDTDADAAAVPRRRLIRQHSGGSSTRGDDGDEPERAISAVGGSEDAFDESEGLGRRPTRLSRALSQTRTLRLKRQAGASSSAGSDWNFDTSTAPPSARDDDLDANQPSLPVKRDPSSWSGPGITVERAVSVKPSAGFAAKFKKSQLQVLQHENSTLSEENAKLRQEIQHLESLVAILQGDNGGKAGESVAAFDVRRMRLLQAQNIQLQRQVSLLQDAISGCQQAEASLVSVLGHWRNVVEAAQQDATAAGADERGVARKEAGTSEPIKWMFAAPQRLLTELSRVEDQIRGASTTINATYESKLRVGNRASGFMRDGKASLSMSELFSGDRASLGLLQPSRLKVLEQQLAKVARDLEEFLTRVLQSARPARIIALSAEEEDAMVAAVSDLVAAVKDLLLDVGAFGVVVATPSASLSFESDRLPVIEQGIKMTIPQIMKALGPSSAGNVRERDKHVRAMLKQLQACCASMENDAKACRREAAYWKHAWKTQAEAARELVGRVDRLGRKKLAWVHENAMKPMVAVAHTFDAFQRAHQEGTTRQNPYLPQLMDMLATQQEYVRSGVGQWEQYDRSTHRKLDGLVADFEANAQALDMSLGHGR